MILREKILLGLVGVTAVGAAIVYLPALLGSPEAKTKRVPVDFPALVNKVQLNLKKGEPTSREKRVLGAATTGWLRNPLRQGPLVVDVPVTPLAPPPEYVAPLPEYIGYLNIGTQVIAIIDGQDYRLGETLKGGEFRLSKIYPHRIELLRRGATDPVNVLLQKPHVTGKPKVTEEPQSRGAPK